MNGRTLIMVAGLSVAGFGLVGAGAGATFTDAVHTTQKITAGTIDVTLSSTDGNVNIAQDGKTATFSDLGPTQSVFSSGAVPTTITNNGTATANAIELSASDDHGSDAASISLASQMCVRILSPIDGSVAYDGKLSALESHPLMLAGPVGPQGTDSFSTEFYAGIKGGHEGCDSLTNDAEGGVVTPTITVSYQG